MLSPDYVARRKAIMARLGPGHALLVYALPARVRSGSSHYPFRQQSDVWYLTGLAEPDVVLLLRPGTESETLAFVRPRDAAAEQWEGRRLGEAAACAQLAADQVWPISDLRTRLPGLLANVGELHYAVGLDVGMDTLICETIAGLRRSERRGQRPPRAIVDPRMSLHELRLRKDEFEIAQLRAAARVTAEGFGRVMAATGPGLHEYALAAELAYAFGRAGATFGYEPIVGGGRNATILHYTTNDHVLADGELVLVDAGCELGGYTADVTRTFPIGGRFSDVQAEAYQGVLDVQKYAISMVAPGITLAEIHAQVVHGLTALCVRLGLLEGPVAARVADDSYRTYFMHGTSHWLGLDVHDAGNYLLGAQGLAMRPLEPGMVITIEPGLYVPETAASPLAGTGIRIEDDVLVTAAGHDVLTAAIPKEIGDLHAATCSLSRQGVQAGEC